MPLAIADPSEIRAFAQFLIENINNLRSLRADITIKFNSLHTFWKDTKYEKFRNFFCTTLAFLDVFLNHGEDYVHYLHQKADKLENYLKHSY